MNIVETANRKINVDNVLYAILYAEQTVVQPAGYHQITLTGNDAQRMNEALKEAGFIGEGTLVNPARMSVIDCAKDILKIHLELSPRVVVLPARCLEVLTASEIANSQNEFLALESAEPVQDAKPEPEPVKPARRSKKATQTEAGLE